jgi:hypothetical protein
MDFVKWLIAIGVIIYLVTLWKNERGTNWKEKIIALSEKFWSHKELRIMVAACAVILFFAYTVPGKIELTINHHFSGDKHEPISLQLSDPGWPVKVEVRNR